MTLETNFFITIVAVALAENKLGQLKILKQCSSDWNFSSNNTDTPDEELGTRPSIHQKQFVKKITKQMKLALAANI